MVFSTCENVGEIFETLRHRLHRNCRARQIGHVGVTFPIGRLGVNAHRRVGGLLILAAIKDIIIKYLNFQAISHILRKLVRTLDLIVFYELEH